MPEYIVGGEADGEQVRGRPGTQLFVENQLLRELKLIIIREGRGSNDFIKAGRTSVLSFARSRRSQDVSVFVLPLAVPVLIGAMAAVEIPRPLRKLWPIVGGSDPGAGLRINPVGAIAGKARRQNGGAVFQGNREYTGLPASGELQF